MDFQALIDMYLDSWTAYLIPMAVGHLIGLLVVWRMFNTMRIYFGAKGFVRKASKQRRKKFNGLLLNEFTEKKRKKNTNTYKKLKRRSKNKVEKYFKYKIEELPGITNYSYGKMFKRNKHKLTIFVSNGKKKIMKIHMKKAYKKFIDLTNKYECLDEFVQYLHNLPEAIMNQQEYDIYISDHDVSIGYLIK